MQGFTRALALRGIALELERVANHTGDLGALAGDVGFLPTASYCGRIRGDFLNMTALLCGSRFGWGLCEPRRRCCLILTSNALRSCTGRLRQASERVTSAVNLLWETSSVMARSKIRAHFHPDRRSILGLSARQPGPADWSGTFGMIFRLAIPVCTDPHLTWATGDVFARAYVRWLEMQRSTCLYWDQIEPLPSGDILGEPAAPAPDSLAISLVEGWRGEICHVAVTDAQGGFSRYKIVDPSFHNWIGLAMAMRNQQISDFPLCNKSFNLSYCGHDL